MGEYAEPYMLTKIKPHWIFNHKKIHSEIRIYGIFSELARSTCAPHVHEHRELDVNESIYRNSERDIVSRILSASTCLIA